MRENELIFFSLFRYKLMRRILMGKISDFYGRQKELETRHRDVVAVK